MTSGRTTGAPVSGNRFAAGTTPGIRAGLLVGHAVASEVGVGACEALVAVVGDVVGATVALS